MQFFRWNCKGASMRYVRVLPVLVLTLGLGSQSVMGQTEADWRFSHPQATLVGGVRVGAILQSPLVKKALEQATSKDPQIAMGAAMAQTMLRGITDIRFS